MLLKATDIIGKKVLSVANGKEFAEVDDIVYDPQENRVKALVIDPGGWFADAKVILFEDTKSIGRDEILVNSEKVVKKASEVSRKISGIANDNKHLTHTKIITEDGTKLGRVTDILFDPKTGKVEGFEVSKGGLLDFASGKKTVFVSDIVTVGTDATIVKGYAKEELQKQKGGIKGAWESATKRSQTVFNDIRTQVSGTSSRMRSQAKKTTQTAIGQHKNDAAGKYLTKNILLSNDKILAKKGTMITNKLLREAEKTKVLDQVLRNYSENKKNS